MNGIKRQLTASYTPQQNGVAERKNRTIVEMAKSMLKGKGLPNMFWAEAVATAVYLLNRSPTKAVKKRTPYEAWSGRKPEGPVLRKYPARLSVTSFTCFFGLIQFLAIAAFVETDIDHWKIQSGGELLTILYAGLVASGISFSLQIWCIDRGGPLFVAVFQPLQTVLVAIMASLVLGDQLYSGGIVGAIPIMTGLYCVVWGKTEEKRVKDQEKEKTLTKHLIEENSQRDSAAAADIP